MIALNASLRLRRTRGDNPNPQLGAHPTKLGQRFGPRLAFLLIRGPHIHILPVGVERLRHAVARNPRPQHADRRPNRLLRAKPPQRLARRVIDERQQTALRPAPFEPRVKTAVHLDQFAEMRLALPPAPMRAALAHAAPQARGQHPPPQRFVIDRHPVFTRQMLRRQRRPKALIDPAAVFLPHERQHSLPNLPGDRVLRRAPRAPMFQACSSISPVSPIQPLRLAIAHLHQHRRRPQSQRPGSHSGQHAPALQLVRAHRCPSQSTTSSEVVSLGDISIESARGHYQRVTTVR